MNTVECSRCLLSNEMPGVIIHMRGIQVALMRTQLAFNIPLAIRGTSRRTEEHLAPEVFLPSDLSFIENVLKGSPLEKEAEILLTPVGLFRSPRDDSDVQLY